MKHFCRRRPVAGWTMTRPHSQISSMIKLYGQANASANKVDHERWQRERASVGEGFRQLASGHGSLHTWLPLPSPTISLRRLFC
jgi:hypothetical protein